MPTEPRPVSPGSASESPSGIGPRVADDDAMPTVASFLEARTRHPEKVARKLHVSRDEACELLQKTAHDFLKEVDIVHKAAWWSWWARTLHHRRCDLAREQKRSRKRAAEAEHQLPATLQPHLSPEAELIRRENAAVVGWCLDQVKPSRREVAKRIVFGEREPYEQIAEELGVPVATVKSRWLRAIEDMRAAALRKPKEERDRLRLALLSLLSLLFAALWERRTLPTTPNARAALARRLRHGVAPLVACVAASVVISVHHGLPLPVLTFVDLSNAQQMASAPGPKRAVQTAAVLPGIAAAAPPSPRSAAVPLAAPSVTPTPRSSLAGLAMARGFLGRATAALRQGNVAAARGALHLYDLRFPENPLPEDRAEVTAGIAARRSP